MSRLLTSGDQSTGASASVLPMNIQGWFPLGLIDLLSLLSKSLWRVFSSTTIQKHQILRSWAFFMFQLSHPCMIIRKTMALIIWTFISKVISLHFNMVPRLVIAFLPRSKCLLISWLQSPSITILEPQKIKSVTVSLPYPPSTCHEVMKQDAMIFIFWVLSFCLKFIYFNWRLITL